MPHRVPQMLERHGRAFLTGGYDRSVQDCAYPFPLYIGDDLILIRDQDQMRRALDQHRISAYAAGMVDVSGEITSLETDGPMYCRVGLKWTYRMKDGGACTGQSHRFISLTGDRPKVAMLDVDQIAIPTKFT